MRVSARFLLPALVLLASLVEAQDGGFQLPVQLIGFPVIIMAVRISNFMKKLAYAVNPRTYSRRTRRAAVKGAGLHALGDAAPDPSAVEKLLVGEFGERVCVEERVCAQYAQRALHAHGHNALLDWDTVFSRYKSAPAGEKQNYLLSVFLGDMVRSPALCMGLAKRGRSCAAMQAAEKTINHLQDHKEHHPATSTARTTSITSSTRSTSSSVTTTVRRRLKPNTHVAGYHPPSHRYEHHHVESHQEKQHQPARGTPAHRQPAHPPAHHPAPAPANHRVLEHHSEVHRMADHPAQTARRPLPARRRPTPAPAATTAATTAAPALRPKH